jgi:8-oxo-dGTP pyrophosphatase MutT (NUDIX family)
MSARTTYDGVPVAQERPFGASVIVYRQAEGGLELLLLHRAHGGPDFEGDWAWTPPAGARQPGEEPDAAAARELLEETGLRLPMRRICDGSGDWLVYAAEAAGDCSVVLDAEHDRFEWVPAERAPARCRPEQVAWQLRLLLSQFD